jgi:ABC-2 type transport system permease protein
MRTPTASWSVRAALVIMMTVVVAGCGSSPITPARIERSIAPTFANLVHLQVTSLGLPPMTPADFDVTASCRKLMAGNDAGSGEWVCTVAWKGPDRRTLRDTYDLFVTTDGCYTANVEGESLGGPTLKTSDGSDVRNLLYTFEGCFDTT